MPMLKEIVLHVSLDGQALRSHVLDQEQVLIGCHPSAQVLLEGPSIAPLHARILNCESRFLLEDCGSMSGTCVNGARKRTRWLEQGDTIRIGKYHLGVELCETVRSYGDSSDGRLHSSPTERVHASTS